MQPGIIFGANDSGHDAVLFAFDTAGLDRGSWLVTNAQNRDWEAMSSGPCGSAVGQPALPRGCLYIADVGDNGSNRTYVTMYRIAEPPATAPRTAGTLRAERLHLRYPGRLKPDVEATFVAANGDLFLVSKRPMSAPDGRARPSLVFRVAASSWGTSGTVISELVDSLPIVPGSAPGRQVTDASLSQDGHRLAVRTYTEVFVLAVDPLTGRLVPGAPWWSCPIAELKEQQGEGVAWLGDGILLTSEGRDAPMHVISCPPPVS